MIPVQEVVTMRSTSQASTPAPASASAATLRTAVSSLGLNDVAPFDLDAKVLGRSTLSAKALVRRTVVDFTDEVSRHSPAPGGGSVAALAGALGAALADPAAWRMILVLRRD